MRPSPFVAAGVALGALALASPATASPQFQSSYKLKLTTGKPGASSGYSADLSLQDLGDPMKRPKILTGVRISFPAGSRFDTRGHVACRSRSKPLTDKGPMAVCSRASRYGAGRAEVILGTTPLAFPIRSFNFIPLDFDQKRPGLLLDVVLDPKNPNLAFDISGPITGRSIFFSLQLTPMFDIHTTRIHFAVPAARRGRHIYLRTPSTCPRSRHWTGTVSTTFVDHSKETRRVKLPCRRP